MPKPPRGSRSRHLALSLAPMLALQAAFAGAHFPGVFGRDFMLPREPSALPTVAMSGPPPRTLPDPEKTAPLEEAMAGLEGRDGPYASGLYEPRVLLGRLHRESGDYRGAGRLFQEALHAIRVNDGLYSPLQLPVLEELILLYRQSGDLEALDRAYEASFRVAMSAEALVEGEGAKVIDAYLAWQREAQHRELDGDANGRLLALVDDTQRLLERVMADPDAGQAQQRHWTLAQLDNLYLVLGDLPIEEQTAGLFNGPGVIGGSPRAPEYVRQRISRLQRTAVGRGRDLLLDYRRRWPAMDPREAAELSLELGDWYQWNDKPQSALEHYRAAVNTLRNAELDDELERWFASAAALPAREVFAPQIEPDADPPSTIVAAEFQVSSRGNVTGITATAEGPEGGQRARFLKSMLRDTHFRPKILADGTPADCVVTRRYEVFGR